MNGTEFLAGFEFRYGCELETLPDDLRQRWVQLHMDAEGRDFVERRFMKPHGTIVGWLHTTLRAVLSDFDVNGLLGTYPLHLLSPSQWQQLLPTAESRRHVDVGAGNGDLTLSLARSCSSTTVTEQSRAMCRVLRRRGFPCVHTPNGTPAELDRALGEDRYELISALNVLDRTSHPRALLRVMQSHLAPGGLLVLSVPLPFTPFYYAGPATRSPREVLPIQGGTWSAQLSQLVAAASAELDACRLFRVSRAPYISGGDQRRRLYVLDAAVLVFERPPAERPAGSAFLR